MTVKELIGLLQNCNQELSVYSYNRADESGGNLLLVKETAKPFPYCKNDLPSDLHDGDSYIIIYSE